MRELESAELPRLTHLTILKGQSGEEGAPLLPTSSYTHTYPMPQNTKKIPAQETSKGPVTFRSRAFTGRVHEGGLGASAPTFSLFPRSDRRLGKRRDLPRSMIRLVPVTSQFPLGARPRRTVEGAPPVHQQVSQARPRPRSSATGRGSHPEPLPPIL